MGHIIQRSDGSTDGLGDRIVFRTIREARAAARNIGLDDARIVRVDEHPETDGRGIVTHGGARPGAGRKPTAKTPRSAPVGPLLLTPAEAATLRARASERGLSLQEAIRVALRCDGLID